MVTGSVEIEGAMVAVWSFAGCAKFRGECELVKQNVLAEARKGKYDEVGGRD